MSTTTRTKSRRDVTPRSAAVVLTILLAPEEHAAFLAAKERDRAPSLTEWVRQACRAAAARGRPVKVRPNPGSLHRDVAVTMLVRFAHADHAVFLGAKARDKYDSLTEWVRQACRAADAAWARAARAS